MGGVPSNSRKNLIYGLVIVILAVLLGILLWMNKVEEDKKSAELQVANKRLSQEKQEKQVALKQKEAMDSFCQKLADGNDVDYDLAIICYGQNDGAEGFSTNYEFIIRAIRSKYTDCSIISILESSQREYTEKMTTIQSICEHYSIPVADTIAAFNNSGKAYDESKCPTDNGFCK